MRNSILQKESRISHLKSYIQPKAEDKGKMIFPFNTSPSTFHTREGSPFPDENRTPAHRRKSPANGHDGCRPAAHHREGASRNRKSVPRRPGASRGYAAASALRQRPVAHRYLRQSDVAGSPPTPGNRSSNRAPGGFECLPRS